MLGYVGLPGRGMLDARLCALADELAGRGLRVAGVVQHNGPDRPDRACDMDLMVLTGARVIRISQQLGPGARGCRLDAQALEQAVAEVESELTAAPPDLVLINKFGRQEAEGRGFRTVITAAVSLDVPVVIGVQDSYRPAFLDWAGEFAQPVDPAALTGWCLAAAGHPATAGG